MAMVLEVLEICCHTNRYREFVKGEILHQHGVRDIMVVLKSGVC